MTVTSEGVRRGTRPVDFVNVGSLLSEEEKAVRDRVREYVDREVIPGRGGLLGQGRVPVRAVARARGAWDHGRDLLEEYGCAGWNNVAYGLAIAELARGSGSLATFLHVQSGLAMTAIHELGSEEQKAEVAPADGELREDRVFRPHRARGGQRPRCARHYGGRRDGGYVLNGEKKWIGNASFSDVAVIWARTEDGKVAGFLVETDNPGFRADVLPRKGSQRAAWQTHIELKDCRVPEERRLPEAEGLGSTLSVLTHSRYGVGWDGLGQAADCYETALAYAREREQFGQPIAAVPARPAEARRDGERDLP